MKARQSIACIFVCFYIVCGMGGMSHANVSLAEDFAEDIVVIKTEPDVVPIGLVFSGQRLLIYGAMKRYAHIVLRVTSRDEEVTVHRLKNRFGFWVSDYGRTLGDTPYFYGVYSSGNIAELLYDKILDEYGFVLQRGLALPDSFAVYDDRVDFYQALLRHRQRQNLWQQKNGGIEVDNNLYKVHIDIPPQAPQGDYSIEAFIISDSTGRLIGRSIAHFQVQRSGWNAVVHNLARDDGVLYGLLGVAFCVILGVFVALLFRRY
ncbi:MAG: TIGR02186 family protein [Alphaproteobacteria bacterium GM7ARS4]|nr:TIGR02186 family protein [Alphaproteobacteria bacterium GM7ARS4]